MPIYTVSPLSQEPDERIMHWSVRETTFADGTSSRHLVGLIPRNQHGRATSAIQQFDKSQMTLITRSGRIYYLEGEPGHDPDAEYVWQIWCHTNGVQSFVDVSHEYLKIH